MSTIAHARSQTRRRSGVRPAAGVRLVVSLLAITGLVGCRAEGRAPTGNQQTTAEQALPAATAARSEFVSFVARGDASGETEAEHRYTAGGLRTLADALAAAIAASALSGTTDGDGAAALTLIRLHADSLEVDGPRPERHGALARSALLAASDVMADVPAPTDGASTGEVAGARETAEQRRATYLLLVASARQAAESMDPTRPLLEQAAAVHTFFWCAAAAFGTVGGRNAAGSRALATARST
jgi:hypothetical protein